MTSPVTRAPLPSPSPAAPVASRARHAPGTSPTAIAKIGAVALKLGPVLFKLLKSGKFLLLFASFAAYAWLWGPLFGAGFLALIAIHESGHVWAMRRAGIKTRGMYFLPFMGAVAVVDQNLKSRWQEYWLTIMGPVFGLAGVLAVLGLWFATRHPIFILLTLAGAFLNLINLLPILPLDGGRILRSVTLSVAAGNVGFAVVGIVTASAAVAAWMAGFGLFAILSLLGLWELSADYRRAKAVRAWRDANPWTAALADAGELKDEHGHPVDVPKLLTPMRPRTMALGVLAAIALGVVLAAIWVYASHASGVSELAGAFS